MRTSAVIFDLDDTLYPEKDYVRSGFAAVASWANSKWDFSKDTTSMHLWDLFQSGVRGDTFDQLYSLLRFPGSPPTCETFVAEAVSSYRSHEPNIVLRTEARQVLATLSKDYRLGLLSDGPLQVQTQKVAALEISEWIPDIMLTDSLGREHWKPSPVPFRELAHRMEVPENRCVYVGDNPAKDFLGARRASMKSIRVRYSDGLHAAVEPTSAEEAPDLEILNLEELPAVLSQLGE